MMWDGPPKDGEGRCNARLSIGDDYGDNSATMRCQLEPGHSGAHSEEWHHEPEKKAVVTWE